MLGDGCGQKLDVVTLVSRTLKSAVPQEWNDELRIACCIFKNCHVFLGHGALKIGVTHE